MDNRIRAQFVARQQRMAQRQALLEKLAGPDVPMDLLMDERLPLSDSERQNLWNQKANEQNSAIMSGRTQAVPYGSPIASSGSDNPFMGTNNQLQQSLAMLQRDPQWQTLDEKSRTAMLQRMYGTAIATQYAERLKDQGAIQDQRRKTFDDSYETERVIQREKRQSGARLAATEPEMLHRNLLSGDWVVRGNGVFERNPEYNAGNPMTSGLPPYLPLSPSGKATVARHWDSVMPGRPNPLHPEDLLRIQVGEENPDMGPDEINEQARMRLVTMMAARKKGVPIDDMQARQRLAGYTSGLPVTPMSAPPAESGLRFGEKLNQFGINAGNDIAKIPAMLDSRLMNVGASLEKVPTKVNQFFSDLMGRNTTLPIPETTPMRTEQSMYYPDWLK